MNLMTLDFNIILDISFLILSFLIFINVRYIFFFIGKDILFYRNYKLYDIIN